MGDILVLAGERYNALETGTTTVLSEDPLYPKSRLYDGRPIQPYRSTFTSVMDCKVDGNRIVNGHVNDWSAGILNGWTLTGNVTETTIVGEVRSGSAVKLDGLSSVEQEITVRAGERINVHGWRRILAAGRGQAAAYLQNKRSGRYWNGSTWVSAPGTPPPFLVDLTNTAYTEYGPTSITLEPFSTVGVDTCTLRLRLVNNDGTAGDYCFFDDWFMWPSIDFCGFFGNNIGADIAVDLYRGATSPATTLEATLTQRWPAFYHHLVTVRDDRHYRLLFSGDNFVPYTIGEIVLGKALVLSRQMSDAGYEWQEVFDTVSAVSETGDHQAVSRSDQPRQVLACEFDFTSHAEMEEHRDEIVRRSLGETRPLIVVPDSTRPEVIMGKLTRDFEVRRVLSDLYSERALIVNGLPFPLLTS